MTKAQASRLGRRHYVMVASLVKMIDDEKQRRLTAVDFVANYGCMNPRFNRERFYAACGVAYPFNAPTEILIARAA